MSAPKPLKQQIADYVDRSSLQLPVFNPVALELQEVLRDEGADASRIEATIGKDPALVVQVLRMANSSLYAGLNEITTLRQALMRLGAKQVSRLAIAAAQLSLYRSKDALVASYMTGLWQQAYASALGASWIAEKSGHQDLAETAFLAALLHDIGKLFILKAIEDIAGKEQPAQSLPLTLIDDMLESLHCEYGHLLMKRWNFPDAYCTVGRDHHNENYENGQVILIMVRLLDQVCARLGIGCIGDPQIMPSASPEAQALGLNDIRMAELEIMLEDNMLLLKAA
jgi:HD-like signal output (HDOD) protein